LSASFSLHRRRRVRPHCSSPCGDLSRAGRRVLVTGTREKRPWWVAAAGHGGAAGDGASSPPLLYPRRGNRDPDHRRHNGRSGRPRDLDARRDRRRHSRHYRHGDCRHYGYRVRRPRTSRHGHSGGGGGGLAPPPRGWAVRCPRRAPPLRHRARVTPSHDLGNNNLLPAC
ncbi:PLASMODESMATA CALLOSE-BINDING PROTEIN 2, partial [Zea mays]